MHTQIAVLQNILPMKFLYKLPRKLLKTFFPALIICLLPSILPNHLSAQTCGCTNCPQFMPDNFVGDFLDVFALLGVGENEGKFIAAEARHGIDFTHALPQAPRSSP